MFQLFSMSGVPVNRRCLRRGSCPTLPASSQTSPNLRPSSYPHHRLNHKLETEKLIIFGCGKSSTRKMGRLYGYGKIILNIIVRYLP